MTLARAGRFAGSVLMGALLAGNVTAAAADAMEPRTLELQAGVSAEAARLAAEVSDLARSSAVSRLKREKQVADAVRTAVTNAIGRNFEPEDVLVVARALATAAAAATPDFAEVIASAAAFSPGVPKGAAFRDGIRGAVYQAAREAPAGGGAAASARDPNLPPGRASSAVPDNLYGKNTAVTFTIATSVRHDDNVFLNSQEQVGDTIMAITPGVELRYGRQSLVSGSIGYKATFAKYADDSAPRATLSAGSADIAHATGGFSMDAVASFQQLQQNTGEAAALNTKSIFRRDILNLGANVQAKISELLSVQTGAHFGRTKYESAGLVGSDDFALPVRVFFQTSPKLSVSTGVTYSTVKPQNGGASARDLYYNTGIWGSLTPKLTAQLSVGYRTREVGSGPNDGLWGFDGVFSYAATAKTRLSLVLARNFGTGALGESSTSSRYTLQFSSEPSTHWRFSGALAHRNVDFGDPVFVTGTARRATARQDQFWEGNFQVTYLFTNSFSASLDTTLRNNSSTLGAAEFSNRIIGLSSAYRF